MIPTKDELKSISVHALTARAVMEMFQTSEDGLNDVEAQSRQLNYGLNEIPDQQKRSMLSMFISQFKSLLILILFIAALISYFTGHEIDMWVILAVILANALIGFYQEVKAEQAVASLKNMVVAVAKVMRNGQKISINAADLVPGDIIVLEEGDSIPADARIIYSKNLRSIEAPLTGESVPIEKKDEESGADTPLADRTNMLWKGTFIAGGYAKAVVTATGMQTALGDIASSLKGIKGKITNFQRKTNILARQMAIIAVLSSVLLFGVGYFFQEYEWDELLLVAIAALVSSIPEGLPAVLAIVLAVGAHRMSKRNVIIREFTATETLGAVTTILTDKTGTLTQNTLTVRRVASADGNIWEVGGEGWIPVGNFTRNGKVVEPEQEEELRMLMLIAGISNNSEIKHDQDKERYQLIGDPTEGALLVMARKSGFLKGLHLHDSKLDDFPFNSDLKMRATLAIIEGKKYLMVVGAPEKVLKHSLHYNTKDNQSRLIDDAKKKQIRDQIETWSDDAMRVIALAIKELPDSVAEIDEQDFNDLCFVGITGMIDPPRPDAREAVMKCRSAGIRVIMATGDHIKTGIAIARATGIIDEHDNDVKACTEAQLLELDEKEFEQVVKTTNVFARLTPQMKLRIAETLQRQGELIAMTGDGVNDAPALKKADVGVAMGIMGTDVARDASKVVLADDNFATIVNAIEEGRIVFKNARQTSFFLLTTNFAEIITLVTSIIAGLPLPLTATQILWLNLVTDGVGDKALATERKHGDVLKEKPVKRNEAILNKEIVPFLLINAVVMTILTLAAFKYFLPESEEKARSAAFITMAFCQLYNIFNMRSIRQSMFTIGFFSNKYVNIALIVSIVIQVMIVEIPFFERLFKFDPISFTEFVSMAALASFVLIFGEILKFFKRRLIPQP
ncbi:MAG: cation-translocating P-type ATPase [Flavobacteriales bacterium]